LHIALPLPLSPPPTPSLPLPRPPCPALPPPSSSSPSQGDSLNHKRYLDDQVVRSFEDFFETDAAPFEEDLSWSNLKMGIMTAASLSALLAQFYPLPFPANVWLLGGCVAVYFALSGVLQFMVTFLDKDAIYASKPPAGGGERAWIRTSLPRGEQMYTVIVECPPGKEVARLRESVGRYFAASDGSLVPENVARDLHARLAPWRDARAAAAGKGGGKQQQQQGKPAKGGAGKGGGGGAAAAAGSAAAAGGKPAKAGGSGSKPNSRAASPERSSGDEGKRRK
jgi:hypothetical protein